MQLLGSIRGRFKVRQSVEIEAVVVDIYKHTRLLLLLLLPPFSQQTLKQSVLVALLLSSVLLKLRYFVRAPGEQSLIPLELHGRMEKMMTITAMKDGFPPIPQILEWTDTAILLICTIIFSIVEARNLSVRGKERERTCHIHL